MWHWEEVLPATGPHPPQQKPHPSRRSRSSSGLAQTPRTYHSVQSLRPPLAFCLGPDLHHGRPGILESQEKQRPLKPAGASSQLSLAAPGTAHSSPAPHLKTSACSPQCAGHQRLLLTQSKALRGRFTSPKASTPEPRHLLSFVSTHAQCYCFGFFFFNSRQYRAGNRRSYIIQTGEL